MGRVAFSTFEPCIIAVLTLADQQSHDDHPQVASPAARGHRNLNIIFVFFFTLVSLLGVREKRWP
jgi:hypothetical protein